MIRDTCTAEPTGRRSRHGPGLGAWPPLVVLLAMPVPRHEHDYTGWGMGCATGARNNFTIRLIFTTMPTSKYWTLTRPRP